jgi:hypothetical protein
LRNFLRYAIDNWAFPPQYVVFIGDGDYDYRNIVSEVDKNWIPPYESSVACYDDFYAYVHQNGLPEIILGRYPVISTAQVQILVNKVLKYQDDPLFTPWRTRFTLVGDDEYGEGGEFDSSGKNHVPQSENLYASILPQFLNFNKIYLTEYPVVPGSGGREKPAATDDLIDAINRGTVVVNYYGHGNETVWAHEHVFLLDRDLSRINNGDKYTIYIAGTCDWGYFDIPDRQSFPEQLLTLPANGAIATVSATRLTFSDPNQNLIESIFEYLFADQYNPTTLGEALMMGKIFAGDLANSQSYHLLGDPMLTPCFPRNPAQVTSMQPDSLFAVNLSQASGQIYSGDQIWNDFNGTVYLEVFDAAQFVVYNFAMDTTTTTYILPGKSIFRGPVSASGGNFTSNFVLPLDLTYGGTLGRVSVYFTNNQTDGCGFRDNIYTGSGGVELTDSDSPQAQVFFGDRSYRPGDPVSTSPLFLADIADTFGINLGSSSGHQIALMVDDNLEFNLTEYFEYQLNSYSSGVLQKQLDYLPPGLHDLKFRAWDNFNHPVQLEFTLETADIQPGQDYLYGLLNYPNPFKQQTTIVFHLLEPAEVKIEIYTVGGKLIRALPLQYCQGYVYDRFEWDGRDEKGDKVANGVYLFKVKADFGDGTASKIGRMILMK